MPLDKSRLGRCYELSGEYLAGHPGTELVHGSIQGMGHPRLDHAWVSGGDHVWEPILDLVFPTRTFTLAFNAKAHQVYKWDVAMEKMVDTGHYGPWDDQTDEDE